MSSTTTPQQPPQRSAPLWWFVSLSLLLHAGLLWYARQSPITIAAPASGGFAVRLVAQPQAAPLAKAQPKRRVTTVPPLPQPAIRPKPPAPAAASDTESTRQAKAQPGQDPAALAANMAETGEPPAEPAAADDAALQSSLQVTLQQEIARHFNYPLLARRRGWQGEVLLAFRLEADGRISDARVLRSSGYGVLDRAALTALGKVGRIAAGLSRGLAMELPVIYRLEG
jgi:protein TonB